MIDRDNPYEGRRRPRAYQQEKALRQPTPQQSGKGTSRQPTGMGDVKDAYLRGQTSNPFSAAHVAPRKK